MSRDGIHEEESKEEIISKFFHVLFIKKYITKICCIVLYDQSVQL